ncbi:MAG: YncE family protein [Planctomycetota bacterium]
MMPISASRRLSPSRTSTLAAFIALATLHCFGSLYGQMPMMDASIKVSDDIDPIVITPRPEQPYHSVDNQQGVWRSPNYPPFRPMALVEATGTLFALNNNDSRLQVYTPSSVNTMEPTASYRVPWLPVSLALWEDPNDNNALRVLVASRGSWCVAMLDAATGVTLQIHHAHHPNGGRLLAEPGDIIVDQAANKAYVSYSADDMVVEIDLIGTMTDLRHFAIPGKHPIFLAFDANGDVLVTPLLSGNNSVAHQNDNPVNFEPRERRVIDTTDPTLVVAGGGLPDEDVFRIVLATGVVEPAVTAAGTTMFAHGVNPQTGDHWALNTEANNKDPSKRGVHAIAGEVVRNRISISTLPAVAGSPVTPHTFIDLDKFTDTTGMGNYVYDPNGNFESTMTLGQPFNLTFLTGGYALVCSPLSDRVHAIGPAGNFIFSTALGAGDICRQVLYHNGLNSIICYNWGSNTIKFFVADGTSTPWLTLNLGYDPTPPEIQEGRALAYDGSFSAHDNASCFTCHIDGRTDGIVWDIADVIEYPTLTNPWDGLDDKGPMLTQTLAGIKRVINFHWRGEQRNNLLDFNDAFLDLLGSSTAMTTGPGSQFEKFEKYIFSIDNPANPRADRRRIVNDNIQPVLFPGFPAARAASEGQALFNSACAFCHAFPMSTDNDNVADGAILENIIPKQIFFKIAPFQEMWRREFDADPLTPGMQWVEVDWIDSIPDLPDFTRYAPNGAGLSRAGLASGAQHFVFFFPFNQQQNASVTGFVDQWDSGLAPACHRAILIDQDATMTQVTDVTQYLINQADAVRTSATGQQFINCDLIAYGTANLGAGPVFMEWLYDRVSNVFVPADSTQSPRSVNFFISEGLAGRASTTFVAVPHCMGERFGVDYDNDGLYNGDETVTWMTDPYLADHDGDTYLDGHEVDHGSLPADNMSVPNDGMVPTIVGQPTILWKTTKVARLVFETSEPTIATVNWTDSAGASGTETSDIWSTCHSLVLINLTPSRGTGAAVTVTGTISLTDRAGNPGTGTVPSFTTLNFQGLGSSQTKLDSLTVSVMPATPPATGMIGTASVRVVERHSSPLGNPIGGQVVLARIFVNGVLDTTITGGVPNFDYDGAPYPHLNGPYLVSTTSGSNGMVQFAFGVPNASSADEICINMEVVAEAPSGWNPALPAFPANALSTWSFSDTAKADRKACQ